MAFRSAKRFAHSRKPGYSQRRQKRIFYGLMATATAVIALFTHTL